LRFGFGIWWFGFICDLFVIWLLFFEICAMFPLFLDLRDRLCVVVGGGPVGRRKVAALLAAGARVRLVCLEERDATLASSQLEWLREEFQPAHLDEADLVFAAAPAEVNRRVVAEAGRRKVWTNSADAPEAGDFYLPATVRRGDLVIAIGTKGAAPALAHKLRQRLEMEFDDAYADWVALLGELRGGIRTQVPDPAKRRLIYQRLCHWRWLKRLRREDVDSVRSAMSAMVRKLADLPEEDV